LKLNDISSEPDLRQWLRDHIDWAEGRLKLTWIEPSIYGSSVGQPDCTISSEGEKIGVELKYLLKTRKGIKWTVRPSQRRYHHMHMRNGGKSALLAYIPAENRLILVRGNNIPLRDYISDPASGFAGKDPMLVEAAFSWRINMFSVNPDENAIYQLEKYLFGDSYFWSE
jgi:hypothetical protein